jgi:restriction system protein
MTVPDFQSLMSPLLKITGDRREHNNSEVIDILASEFELTEDDRKEMLPSGRQLRFDNRVMWARAHLKMAGLLEITGRGRFRITERGYKVFKENHAKIDVKFLMQFPDYAIARNSNAKPEEPEEETKQTPDEILESSYQSLRIDLAKQLVDQMMNCSPGFFEKLVVDLLVALGYGGSIKDAGQAVGQSGDGGIDGIIKEDKLGLDFVYIQAKRWEGTVGRPVVQAFAGSLMGQNARKGVFMTTSQFSKEARDYVKVIPQPKIVLIDGKELAELMIDHNIGVAEVTSYTIKKVDIDYFNEE